MAYNAALQHPFRILIEARLQAVERPSHMTCPGVSHSTAHDDILSADQIVEHLSHPLSDKLAVLYHYLPTMSIGILEKN